MNSSQNPPGEAALRGLSALSPLVGANTPRSPQAFPWSAHKFTKVCAPPPGTWYPVQVSAGQRRSAQWRGAHPAVGHTHSDKCQPDSSHNQEGTVLQAQRTRTQAFSPSSEHWAGTRSGTQTGVAGLTPPVRSQPAPRMLFKQGLFPPEERGLFSGQDKSQKRKCPGQTRQPARTSPAPVGGRPAGWACEPAPLWVQPTVTSATTPFRTCSTSPASTGHDNRGLGVSLDADPPVPAPVPEDGPSRGTACGLHTYAGDPSLSKAS